MKGKGIFSALLWPLAGMLLFAFLLYVERSGVTGALQGQIDSFLPRSVIHAEKKEPECLVLYNGAEETIFYSTIQFVLQSMSVGYHLVDINDDQTFDLSRYDTVVVAATNLDLLQPSILRILDWVEKGGQLLFAYPPEPSATLSAIAQKLGILNTDLDYGTQIKARLISPFMPGGQGQEFLWSFDDRQGLVVQLTEACTVHMVSENKRKDEVPMLWEVPLGRGKVVVNNNDAFAEPRSRGLVSAVYSLMGKAFAYPVINASMFFIDDFPAPIPEGHNEYIDRFYGMNVDSFYDKIWFPNMLKFASQYGLRYTGLLVESYDDHVQPPFSSSVQTERFRYFGNILLQDGHEIGLHGYNHMPLVLPSFDFKEEFPDYKKWGSTADMAQALNEAIRFGRQTIPGSNFRTYVPPSNVLSAEGRQMLREYFPQINVISSVYMPDDDEVAYRQEFGVGEDGIVDLPRIAAGYQLSDYARWAVLCELSFHYVNSHFLHPDDVLDEQRGAKAGWEELSKSLNEHLRWLYGSAKGLRSLTAQQGAMAVQRYNSLAVRRTLESNRYVLELGGFYDEAWLLVRFNGRTPGRVKGGSLQYICGNLYLLHATADHVEISLKGGD